MRNIQTITTSLCLSPAFCATDAGQDAQPKPAVDQPSRTPIAAFKNGASLELSRHVHANWDLPHRLSGGDASVYVNLRGSEVFRTAIFPTRRPTSILPTNNNPAIGKIKAQTRHFAELTPGEFLQPPRSYAQGFIVVHKGQVVYENNPGEKFEYGSTVPGDLCLPEARSGDRLLFSECP